MKRKDIMRHLELFLDKCENCPYCQYDGYYSNTTDSGWDCNHPDRCRRIPDEVSEEKSREAISSGMPSWCPLNHYDEE